MVDLTIANAILKDDYLGPLRSAVNTSTPALVRLEVNQRDIAGRQAWIPIEMDLNQGAGARAENAVLPTAGQGEYQELKVPLKHYYGSMNVTGPVLRQTSKGERGSFGRIIDIEAKGMRRSLGLVLAHDLYVGETYGTTTGATSGDATVEIDATALLFNMQWFHKNQLVDILDAGGTPVAGGTALTITAVDRSANTITVSGGPPSDVAGGSVRLNGTTKAAIMTPLEEIIDDTVDIYGVTTATFENWQASVNNTFGSFTVKKLQTLLDRITVASGKMPTAIYSDLAVQQLYFLTLVANPRYMVAGDAAKTLDNGFSKLTYTGGGSPIPWMADRLAPAETMYLVHEPDIQVFSPGDFEFIDIGGDLWLPDILGSSPKDNFKAILFRDFELGAYNRNSHAKAHGVVA